MVHRTLRSIIMFQAVQTRYYACDIRYPNHTSLGIYFDLLGSSAQKLPVMDNVGIGLVPCIKSTLSQNHGGINARENHLAEKTTTWKRVGPMRWIEICQGSNQELHYNTSQPHNFPCTIIQTVSLSKESFLTYTFILHHQISKTISAIKSVNTCTSLIT